MSGNLYGADVEALRQLADRIAQGGEALNDVVGVVESAMPVPEQWSGMDAESFRDEWYGSHGPSITATAQALALVADTVLGNADDQEATSDDLSGGGIGVDMGRGIGVDPGRGAGAGGGERGSGTEAEPLVLHGESPNWFEDFLESLGVASTFEGIAGTLIEHVKSFGNTWNQFGKGFGGVFSALGIATGGHQYFDSMTDFIGSGDPDDLYTAGDGYVSMVLGAGTFIPVVGLGFGVASGAWGLASLANSQMSDRPLTQNMIDNGMAGMLFDEFSDSDEQLSEVLAEGYHDLILESAELTEDVVDAAGSAADAVGDTANDIVDGGRDLLEDAGDLFDF